MLFVVQASILLQLTAAVLALRLIPLTRHRLAWGLWCFALLLMAVRRVVSLSSASAHDLTSSEISAELIALVISTLLVVGMSMLAPLFQSMRGAQELLAEQLEERHLMARELHDTLGQSFAGVLLQLEAAEACLHDPALAQVHRERARKAAQSGLHEARDGMLFLRQPNLGTGEITDSLEKFFVQVRRDYDQEICFELGAPMPELDPILASECFRIVQEAVINAARHAQSDRIEVYARSEGHERRFTIQDHGIGMEDHGEIRAGLGLISIKERTERIGASLFIDSKLGRGTCVRLIVRV